MASIVVSPEKPLAKTAVRVTFASLEATTNHVELFATSAPLGSQLRAQIDSETSGRHLVFNGPSSARYDFTPDKGGVYGFLVQEVSRGEAKANVFQGDRAGAANPTLNAQSSVSVHVGEKLRLKLGQQPDECELVACVWGNTITATTVEFYGFGSPALENPTSLRAESAALNAALVAAVGGLSGISVDTALGSIAADFVTTRNGYNTHVAKTTSSIHDNSDELRRLGSGYVADDPIAAETSINALRQRFVEHISTMFSLEPPAVPDPGDPLNPPLETHDSPDGKAAFMFSGAASSTQSHFAALADMIVALEIHKANTGSHSVADDDSVTIASPLLNVHCAWFRALRLAAPQIPIERNSGAAKLEQLGGFTIDEQ
jgi:hypothetical protein